MNHRRSTRVLLAVIAWAAVLAVACGPAHSAGSPPANATPVPGTADRPGTPTPFPTVTARVIGSTQQDAGITALAASGDDIWLAVDDAILESSDRGAHWRQASTIAGGANSLSFVSPSEGWAGTSSGLLHTADGGATWAPLPTAGAAAVTRVRFVGATHGWIGVKGDGIERTTDGGATWAGIPLPCASHIGDVLFGFFSAIGGWGLCRGEATEGAQAKELYSTIDGGAHWTLVSYWHWGSDATPSPFPIPDGGALDIFFLDASHGWVGADRWGVQATTDGAHSWDPTSFDAAGDPDANGVVFVTSARGYAFVGTPGRSFVGMTADGGATWTTIYTKPTVAAPEPVLAGETAPFQLGGRTSTWSTLLPGFQVISQLIEGRSAWIIAGQCHTEVNSPKFATITHQATSTGCGPAQLLHSGDAGTTWTAYTVPDVRPEVVFRGAGQRLRVGDFITYFESSDDGHTWMRVEAPLLPSAPEATVEPRR